MASDTVYVPPLACAGNRSLMLNSQLRETNYPCEAVRNRFDHLAIGCISILPKKDTGSLTIEFPKSTLYFLIRPAVFMHSRRSVKVL